MYSEKNAIIQNIKELIDISCLFDTEDSGFRSFHLDIIKMAYDAIEVSIDYARNRVYMNVVLNEDCNMKALPFMPINLAYSNLNDFLRSCVLKDKNSLELYSSIMADFSIRKNTSIKKTKNIELLERA